MNDLDKADVRLCSPHLRLQKGSEVKAVCSLSQTLLGVKSIQSLLLLWSSCCSKSLGTESYQD